MIIQVECLVDAIGLLDEVMPGDRFAILESELRLLGEVDIEEVFEDVRGSVVANDLEVFVLRNQLGDDFRILDLEVFARKNLQAFAVLKVEDFRAGGGVGCETDFETHRNRQEERPEPERSACRLYGLKFDKVYYVLPVCCFCSLFVDSGAYGILG